jgi:hypothetical protein
MTWDGLWHWLCNIHLGFIWGGRFVDLNLVAVVVCGGDTHGLGG